MPSIVPIKPSPPANSQVASVVMTLEARRAIASASIRVALVRPVFQIMVRCARRPTNSCRLCRSNWNEKDSKSANSKSTSRGSRRVSGNLLRRGCERVNCKAAWRARWSTRRSGPRASIGVLIEVIATTILLDNCLLQPNLYKMHKQIIFLQNY